MPHTIVLPAIQATLKDGTTAAVLDFYQKALETSGLLVTKENKDDILNPAAEGVILEHNGLWERYVLTTLAALLDRKELGQDYFNLPAQVIKLDPPAQALFNKYAKFLTDSLLNERSSSSKPETAESTCPFKLTKGLILRLVGHALHVEMNHHADGDKLLMALEFFMEQVFAAKTSEDWSWRFWSFGSPKNILGTVPQDQPLWLRQIRQVVNAGKLMHGHRNSVSEILNSLDEVQRVIHLQLLACINHKLKAEDYFGDKAVVSLEKEEDEMIAENIKHVSRSLNVAVEQPECEVQRQHHILSAVKLKKLPPMRAEKIEKLYALQNRLDVVLKVFNGLDAWLETSSWAPIISNAINFDSFNALLQSFSQECEESLSLDPALREELGKTANTELSSQQANNGYKLSVQFTSHGDQMVTNLCDPKVKSQIGAIMESAVLSMINIQRAALPAYQLVNVDLLVSQGYLVDRDQAQTTPNIEYDLSQSERELMSAENNSLREQLVMLSTCYEAKQHFQKQLLTHSIREKSESEITNSFFRALIGQKSPEVLAFLLDDGANINELCELEGEYFGMSAIQIAASLNDQPLCEWLLAQDAALIAAVDAEGQTVLDRILEKGFEQGDYVWFKSRGATHSLLSQEQVINKLHTFLNKCYQHQLLASHKVAEVFCCDQALLNSVDPVTGQTALHKATIHGDKGLIDCLLLNNASIEISDKAGMTALTLLQRSYPEALQLLGSLALTAGAAGEMSGLCTSSALFQGAAASGEGDSTTLNKGLGNK